MAVYLVGLYVIGLNWKEKGFGFIFAGVALNLLAMLLNGGKMPVSLDAVAIIDPASADALKNAAIASKHVAKRKV